MKMGAFKLFGLTLILISILWVVSSPVTGDQETQGNLKSSELQKKELNAPSCLTEETVLEDIKRSHDENTNKKKELQSKEADLIKREQVLDEQLKKLEKTRDEISVVQDKKEKENEEKVNRLVETFLTMSPKAAAKMLATLDDGLAVATISRLQTPKLAKIMNVMDPQRSSKLSELMVGIIGGKPGKTTPTPTPTPTSQINDRREDKK